jgi:hypothetical protein
MSRAATATFIMLLACSVPAGTCLAATYQNGVTTEDDVMANLGQPDSFSLQPDGSVTFVYRIAGSPGVLDYFPLLGLLASDAFADVATITFTFDASTRLTSYAAT